MVHCRVQARACLLNYEMDLVRMDAALGMLWVEVGARPDRKEEPGAGRSTFVHKRLEARPSCVRFEFGD